MDQPSQAEQELTNFCHWHPQAETRISCSRCGKFMCTQCMVQAPVGIRCRECGRVSPMPTFDVRPANYALAAGVAALVALGGGVLWWIIDMTLLFFLGGQVSSLLLSAPALVVGYGGGELISLSVNRKRSVILGWIAGGAVVVSCLFVLLLPGPTFLGSIYSLLIIFVGVFIGIQRVRR